MREKNCSCPRYPDFRFWIPGDRRGELYAQTYLAFLWWSHQGRKAEAYAAWQANLAYFDQVGEPWGAGWALAFLGRAALEDGDYAAAHRYLARGADLFRTLGDQWAAAIVGNLLTGRLAFRTGDYATARALMEQSAQTCREFGFRYHTLSSLRDLAEIAQVQGDQAQAAHYLQEVQEITRQLNLTS